MRTLVLASVAALVLSGLPPAPLPPAQAQQSRVVRGGPDADEICAPYLQSFRGDDYDSVGYGRGRVQRRPNLGSTGVAPPPPPPSPPPPPMMQQPMAEQRAPTVTGSRVGAARQGGLIGGYYPRQDENRERYQGEAVAAVRAVAETPVSTFGVDVDTGSYTNVRRMLNQGQMPPQAAVRTEEMLNYFRYDYPAPEDRSRPFTVSTDMTTTPWNANTRLLRVGLRGYDMPRRARPAANLVFLVDVSGSMNSIDKLPLVQCSLAIIASRINRYDHVSIVVYAGAAGLVLEPTSDRETIMRALDRLQAGGSTAGAAGIQLAYRVARQNMIEGGINRVILATDGDFNVGITNNETLVDMVERERRSGITLTTLGFGTGNYNEAMMEQIADRGNGNYFYIDTPREAWRAFDRELSSTLFTIAHDVKIQIEFNPAYVREYRLIGYENRALREEDFDNDQVDAGDIGAGHQVTAIYEIVPTNARGWLPQRYFEANQRPAPMGEAGQMAHLRLRYKLPGEDESRLIERPLSAGLIARASAPQGDSAFAAAVAAYGQLLRGDTNMGRFSFADARALALRGGANDYWRQEFVGLTELAQRRRFAGRGGGDED
ncbi:vWA domain-containing protein [Sphingosinicella sp.]|uniref:vWA domain-containing protein n=1 Tax=Sphingosinicella sp. TaxID=1917971 RepID=UPI0040377725